MSQKILFGGLLILSLVLSGCQSATPTGAPTAGVPQATFTTQPTIPPAAAAAAVLRNALRVFMVCRPLSR